MRSGSTPPGTPTAAAFTYLLWAARGDVFAAVAPCAAAAKPEFKQHIKPKPVLHMAGENDPLVRFAWQKRTIDEVRKINGCGEGKPWGEHCTLYPSKTGTPVVTYIHSGGHNCRRRPAGDREVLQGARAAVWVRAVRPSV